MSLTLKALAALAFASVGSSAAGQAIYAAERHARIQAGTGAFYARDAYTGSYLGGIAAWADCDLTRRLGIEARYSNGTIVSPEDIGEVTYSLGPRITLRRGGWAVYVRMAVGQSSIEDLMRHTSSRYTSYAYGGGLERRVGRRWNARLLDAEQQQWPHFPPATLSPLLITVGVSYILR